MTIASPRGDDEPRWHALKAEDAVAGVESDDRGLSSAEARRRLERYGRNALPEAQSRSLFSVFIGQFKSPLIYLLFAAAAIALGLGHTSDAVVIFIVVLLNSIIGAVQEGRAERSLQALRKLATHKARVLRDGREAIVEAAEVVPGDVLLLEAGDAIAADARLLSATALQVAEAALTGESVPVTKALAPVGPDAALADRRNMVYAGTHVTAGKAHAVVVATAMATEIGHIAKLAEAAVEPQTPLERRIAQFGRAIIYAAVVIFIVVNAVGMARGVPFAQIVMLAISQVVGMIPEGLPVAMTIALAVGVQRMARRRAVVRRLAAVETLGSTTVICTDKTGTLTRNEMTVTAVFLPGGRELAVTGAGYRPEGKFLENEAEVDPTADEALGALLEALALCNDAQLHGPEETEPQWRPIGDPTEVALLTFAMKGGATPIEVRERAPRRAEIPFDPAAQMMATQHDVGGDRAVVIKGAPEVVLDLCREPLPGAERDEIHRAAEQMARRALRVLAAAIVEGAEIDPEAGFGAFRGSARFLGLVGEIDPPRPEVKDAVSRCRSAGIRPVVVTGDHKATGYAIASQLGIAADGDGAIDGRELDQMSDDELAGQLDGISVFARVHPAQKLRIVDLYQKRGDVVAMTGDGVNDAPALVKANVGVAMGITGTEVAKEAAEIVITDDNFATIVAAVEEGRVVYRNIKKAVLLLFSTSAAEVVVLLMAMLLGYPPPFAAVQILWNNLVTEGLITVNLVMEPAEGDEMRRRPISPSEPLLSDVLLKRMVVMAPTISIVTLGWFILRHAAGVPEAQVRTETFTLLALCEWYNVLNCRSETKSALQLSVLRNPWLVAGLAAGNLLQAAVVFWAPLNRVFYTVPIGLQEVAYLGLVGSLVLWTEELRKTFARRRGIHHQPQSREVRA
jgi:Ca2+-transporting ATPase